MAFCVNCGSQLASDAKFCAACGTLAGTAAPAGRSRWPRSRSGRAAAITGAIVVGCVSILAVVGVVAGRSTASLPLADDFSGACSWPSGENVRPPADFSYGCAGGQYRLHLRRGGAYHITQGLDLHVAAVKFEIDAVVRSGRGTAVRVQPPSALLGIWCMRDSDNGYAMLVGTNGTDAVVRVDHERFRYLVADSTPGSVAGLDGRTPPGVVHLGIVCASEPDGSTLVGSFVNGRLLHGYRDRGAGGEFRGVGVYANTYPGVVAFDRFRAARPSSGVVKAIRLMLAA